MRSEKFCLQERLALFRLAAACEREIRWSDHKPNLAG
jgi:hypothetical protein